MKRQRNFRIDDVTYEKMRGNAMAQGLNLSDYLIALMRDQPNVAAFERAPTRTEEDFNLDQ